jgi:hypothetical protein
VVFRKKHNYCIGYQAVSPVLRNIFSKDLKLSKRINATNIMAQAAITIMLIFQSTVNILLKKPKLTTETTKIASLNK